MVQKNPPALQNEGDFQLKYRPQERIYLRTGIASSSALSRFATSIVDVAIQVRICDVMVFLFVHLLVVLIVVNVVALVEVAFVFRVRFVLVGLEILVVREVVISVFTT